MFSRFSRLPLRRCLHTGPTSASASSFSSSRAKAVIGASAVLTAYMTWQLTNDRNKISLDAPSTPKPEAPRAKSIPKESRTSEPITRDDLARKPESIQLDDDFVPDKPEEPALSTGGETSAEGESSEEGEGQASAGGAFNPETGEINWDCPCLGGMAHGPCGPEFREAFSCFVYSEAEPKGINCVEKFQNMQNCFRAHPEVYADEIMDDDEEEVPTGSDASNFPPSDDSDDNLNDTTTPGAQKPQIEKNTPIATDSPL